MFSLIIPYHNRRKYLPRTLRSLLNSTLRPRYVYLVDNNSTDGSAEFCRRFADAHPSYPFIHLSCSQPGAAATRNAALQLVETEWVFFFDSDDELSSCYLENVLYKLRQKPDTDVVACATRMHFPDGRVKVRQVMYNASAADQILASQLATQGMCFRTEFLRRIGGWNEQLFVWNDWELGLRVLLNQPRVSWLKSRAYHHIYQHPDSLTSSGVCGRLHLLLPALEAARTLLNAHPQLLPALAARCAILRGRLKHEKAGKEAGQLAAWMHQSFDKKTTVFFSPFVSFLYLYTRLGGRGAWRIARFFLRPFVTR